MAASDVPDWVEGLKWIFAALILAFAFVGPQIMGPMMNRLKQVAPPLQPPLKPHIDSTSMAVIEGTLADKDAVYALAASVDRLCEIMERQFKLEEEETEEAIMRRRIRDAMKELSEKEKG